MGELTDVMKTENEATRTRPGDGVKACTPATFLCCVREVHSQIQMLRIPPPQIWGHSKE